LENKIKADITTLNQLIKYINGKNIDKINEKDTINLIGSLNNIGTKVQYAMRLTRFYRWFEKLGKRERLKNMEWFEHPSKDQDNKNNKFRYEMIMEHLFLKSCRCDK
jgi:hypothetical protein